VEAIVTEVRTVRRAVDWLNPVWSPEVELFEVCSACRARRPLESGAGQHPMATAQPNPLLEVIAAGR
jgi:hypothetical protein